MSDSVKAPAYYLFPNDVQLRAITSYLTGNGAQAVQYVARATRLDGKNKGAGLGDRIQDLEKAVEFINEEIRRLREQADTGVTITTTGGGGGTAVSHYSNYTVGQMMAMNGDDRVHNHDLDPRCREYRDDHGQLRGECMKGGAR